MSRFIFATLGLISLSGVIVICTAPSPPNSLTQQEVIDNPDTDAQKAMIDYRMYRSPEFRLIIIGSCLMSIPLLLALVYACYLIRRENALSIAPIT